MYNLNAIYKRISEISRKSCKNNYWLSKAKKMLIIEDLRLVSCFNEFIDAYILTVCIL